VSLSLIVVCRILEAKKKGRKEVEKGNVFSMSMYYVLHAQRDGVNTLLMDSSYAYLTHNTHIHIHGKYLAERPQADQVNL